MHSAGHSPLTHLHSWVLLVQQARHNHMGGVSGLHVIGMLVYHVAHGATMPGISALFGAPPSTCWRCVVRARDAINTRMYASTVAWPATNEELAEITAGFQAMRGIRSVVGCLDGTHVPCKARLEEKSSYVNRKGWTSMTVLCICDHRMRFRYCAVGAPGCVHDARVWRESSLFQRLLTTVGDRIYYVLGDPAYALTHFW